MRQIKFRGKRVDNGEWVYGLLISRNEPITDCFGVQYDIHGEVEYNISIDALDKRTEEIRSSLNTTSIMTDEMYAYILSAKKQCVSQNQNIGMCEYYIDVHKVIR